MKAKLGGEHSKATEMECPRCDGKLVETDFESVKIDVCDKCHGAWFDAGELAQVIDKDENKGWLGRVFG